MVDKETGGPAFPVAWPLPNAPEPGMTLRDYFAIHATESEVALYVPMCGHLPDALQAARYMHADAMLRSRK